MLSGCTEFLDVKPRGYDIASKLEHYEGLLYGTDMFLLDITFPYMGMEVYTDADGYANAYSTVGSHACNAYKWERDIYREDQQAGEWKSYTSLLYNCNVVIDEVMDAEDGTEEKRRAVLSEARMLRAYCTFMMSQFFGDVPIIRRASTLDNDFTLSSREEVKQFVISEMQEAVPYLQDVPEHYLRIFRTSGYGLLGKVLFMYGEYAQAEAPLLECLRQVGAQPAFGLVDYRPLMDPNGDIDYPVRADINPERLYYVAAMPRLWDAVNASMYNMLMFGVRNDVMEYFFPDRRDCRLAFLSSVSTGKSLYKSYKAKEIYAANMASIVSNTGLDLAEVYTMAAECQARMGNTEGARQLLLTLRTTRMDEGHEQLPDDLTTQDDLIRFAFAERIREEFGFGLTWFEMKRVWDDPLFQDLKPMYVHTMGSETYTLTPDRLYMAYPPSVLTWHPEYVK